MRIPAVDLCALLRRADLELRSPERPRLHLGPGSRVTPEVAAAVCDWKPELCRVLATAGRVSAHDLAPCDGCGCEFVLSVETTCPWCRVAPIGQGALA